MTVIYSVDKPTPDEHRHTSLWELFTHYGSPIERPAPAAQSDDLGPALQWMQGDLATSARSKPSDIASSGTSAHHPRHTVRVPEEPARITARRLDVSAPLR
ncbi:hypothetical protein [Nocardia sp. CA-290969]|uniref:hypothetical protein n=1 Tax=Nocardia sp. CA-290969 TaxID=3239986 RepID=UPI003D9161C5